jgi:hypothetical protein
MYFNNQIFLYNIIFLDFYIFITSSVLILSNFDLNAVIINSNVAYTFFFIYNANAFKGILSDTGAAGVFIAGERQIRILQKKIPDITVNTSITGKYRIKFGDNPVVKSTETVNITTPFKIINFAIMLINTSFFFCFANIKKHHVYLNNTRDVLVHNGRDYPIAIRNDYAWFLLDNLENIVFHFTETELRQLYRRFGYPAADRLQRLLEKTGIKDIDHNVLAKINRICY